MLSTLLLFLGAFILAQADKQAVGLLATPLKAAFALSDARLGLLQGVGFALAFAIGGIPLGRLVDSGNRVRIAAICVALWSLATIGCGLVQSFWWLFAFRALTAFAEAGMPPAFFSIMSQQGDHRRVLRTTSVFMLAPFIGGGLVLIGGGLLLRHAAGWQDTPLAGLSPWRQVFLALGTPGLLLAALMMVVAREPVRPPRPAAAPATEPFGTVLRAIFVTNRFFPFYYAGLLVFTILLFSLVAWYPTLLVRRFGMSTSEAGAHAGIVYLVAGVLGTMAVSTLGRTRAFNVGLLVGGYFVASLILMPVAIVTAVAPTATLSLGAYALYAFFSAGVLASMPVPTQIGLPNAMVGQAIGIFAFLTSAVAGSIGPLAVGLLTDHAGLALGPALAVTGGTAMALAGMLFWAARRHAEDATIE